MKTNVKKRGRPRIHDNPVWFGMKISLEEREKIKRIAKERGTTASRLVMEAIEKEIEKKPNTEKRMTATEMLKLPLEERNKLLRAQAKEAEWIYNNDPDLIFPDNQDIIEY